ncbi:MAG: hypothetical protein RMX68_031670 [Aulosira sp. ZfuVER01]|nr:hypothetical protein [Aulosira sp. ZfuVER01]MDZ7997193.1 hypothetical protein [Aulosira sp. DedVER01a]MDZ8056032.1 hypothetical protein [Aulosira sp. ZfuCHP01]
MLQLVFTRFIKVTAFGITALLLTGQTAVHAEPALPRLTPQQTQRLSRDLVPYNSQDFFRKGQELMEREIQILQQRQLTANQPVLKVNVIPQIKKDNPPSNNFNVLPK